MTSISDTEVVNAPGGLVELGHLEYTGSNVQLTGSANTYIGGTLTCICDGSPIIIEVYCPRVDMAANSDSWIAIEIDGVSQGRVLAAYNPNSGASPAPTFAQIRATPAAGTRTFRMRAYSSSGTTTWLNGAGVFPNTYIRVSKVLQASQLLVTQSNAPIVTSLPSGNLVTGQQVSLYSTSPYAGYQRQMWDGTQWNIMGDSRANTSWQTYNPIFKQGASTISSTISYARYMVMGKTCFVRTRIVASGAGTAPNIISTTVPIAPLNAGYVNGIFVFSDVNPGVNYAALTPIVGSDLVVYGYGFQRGNGFGADPSLAVASGDVIEIALTYEVA